MDDKLVVGILSFLGGVIGVTIGVIGSQAATQRRIQMDNIVKERAKWRTGIRRLASEVHKAAIVENPHIRRDRLFELKGNFRAMLNPFDGKDDSILKSIDDVYKCECWCRCNTREREVCNFGKLISFLLKHDWERAKEEVKHPLWQWHIPERGSPVDQCSSKKYRFRYMKLTWMLLCTLGLLFAVPFVVLCYSRYFAWVTSVSNST